jgi:hypothetical protein
VWERLNYVASSDPKALSVWDRELLDDLKLTIAPWKSKPGSVEAIIDELTEYWDEMGDSYNEIGHGAYWKLVDLGFDAVPALMTHLEDGRLTRAEQTSWKGISKHNVRVGHIAELILGKISGGAYRQEAYGVTAKDWVPVKDHKWWKKAKQIGEEQWLLDIALRRTEEYGEPPDAYALRVIRVKYPKRLADVYQELLGSRSYRDTELVTQEIIASTLPRETKRALLEEGIAAKEFTHQSHALEALSGLHPELFRKHLRPTLERQLREIERDPKSITNAHWVEGLFRKTDDPRCWDILAAMARRTTPDARLDFVGSVGGSVEPNEPDAIRRQRIRYLLGFFDDAEVGELPWQERWIAVRDHATNQLSRELGFLPPEWAKAPQSPREISLLRDTVREAAERELARPRK